MKIFVSAFLFTLAFSRLFEINPSSKTVRKIARKVARKLYLEDMDFHTSSYSNAESDTTHSNFYQMEGHNRRSTQMRRVGAMFSDIDDQVNMYRDDVSKKLDQLSMQLQQPKFPNNPMSTGRRVLKTPTSGVPGSLGQQEGLR